jgi:hypothetical protein
MDLRCVVRPEGSGNEQLGEGTAGIRRVGANVEVESDTAGTRPTQRPSTALGFREPPRDARSISSALFLNHLSCTQLYRRASGCMYIRLHTTNRHTINDSSTFSIAPPLMQFASKIRRSICRTADLQPRASRI